MNELEVIKQLLGLESISIDSLNILKNQDNLPILQTYRYLIIKLQSMYDDLLTKYRDAIEEKAVLEYKLSLEKK